MHDAAGGGPWSAPFARWARALGSHDALSLVRLNALARERGCESGGGVTLRFVKAEAPKADDLPYERRVFEQGMVATRLAGEGAIHDRFNALAWLAFPRLKARLNALHAQALDEREVRGRRGWLRDRVTLFDESGALLLCRDPELTQALRAHQWEELFVARRGQFEREARLLLVGHAVHEKLCKPYKAICAQVWILDLPQGLDEDLVDREAARALGEESLAALTPLPVLGVPGWWPANGDPAFYNDPQIFRQRRKT